METVNFNKMSFIEKTYIMDRISRFINSIQVLFPNCELLLGGSIAISLVIPEFTRDVHDIDIIVRTRDLAKFNEEKCKAVFAAIAELTQTQPGASYSGGIMLDYYIGNMPINLLFSKVKAEYSGYSVCGVHIESMSDILAAKYTWNREKDRKDIGLLREYVDKNEQPIDMPF